MSRGHRICSSIIDAIGETPIVELSRVSRGVSGRVLGKLDYLNPAGSKKDLIARQIIEAAEGCGELKPGQTVVEVTSGNTGNGLAMVCAVKGYPFVAVMSKGNSPERAIMMRAMGAEVVLIEQCGSSTSGHVTGDDIRRVEEAARRLVAERNAFFADQFRREENVRAHYLHSGPQWLQATAGKLDAFCDFVGTGGGFAGCAACFKEWNPEIRCYVVEPAGAAVLAGQCVTRCAHLIQGGGYAKHLSLIRREHVDGYLTVSDDEVLEVTHRLAREEGIFAGYSAGANVAAALKLLRGELSGKTVATTICDSGLKYLSTDLWREACMEQ
ncbi:MAG: cysteine synthase family protein [Verrucomicrobiales bacterium]|nr:cysteine synthase family protein [Verrucomicrobiales bacterium]